AVLQGGEIVRHQMRADLVTLIHHDEDAIRARIELRAVRITQPAGIDAVGAGRAVYLPNAGTVALRIPAVLDDIAVRADGCVELRSVRADRQALGPVVIDRAAGEQCDQPARRRDLCLTGRERI